MVRINVTVHNDNPNTIYNKLKAKLGREPTSQEIKAEVHRILDEGRAEREGHRQ